MSTAVESQLVALREALERYGRHDPSCAAFSWLAQQRGRECTCGFERALEGGLSALATTRGMGVDQPEFGPVLGHFSMLDRERSDIGEFADYTLDQVISVLRFEPPGEWVCVGWLKRMMQLWPDGPQLDLGLLDPRDMIDPMASDAVRVFIAAWRAHFDAQYREAEILRARRRRWR